MTFAAMLADVYRRTGFSTTPASDVVTRIKAFVNDAQQELAGESGLASLLRGTITLASVTNQAAYGLPPIVADVRAITDATNQRKLDRVSLPWYRSRVPSPAAFTGTPFAYAMLGPQAVSANPASTGIWAVSSSGADTTQTVALEAVRAGGYPHSPALTALTGTTRVQLGSQTDYVDVLDVYLSAATAGDITLYDAAAAGNVLGVIPKGQTRSRYEWIALIPTPTAVLTYTIDNERDVTDLVNDTDEPAWLPVRFHRLLGVGARLREYQKTESPLLPSARDEWTRGRVQVLAYVNNPADRLLIPSTRGSSALRSDLGANYPAGTVWD